MRVLDLQHEHQHGSGMEVYSGYGFGKSLRRGLKHVRKHAGKMAMSIGEDVAKKQLMNALQGKEISMESIQKDATHSAMKKGKNIVRPYL